MKDVYQLWLGRSPPIMLLVALLSADSIQVTLVTVICMTLWLS